MEGINRTNVRILWYALPHPRWPMKNRSLSPLLAPFALLLAVGLAPIPGAAQEIPLKHCGKLPVLEVEVASQSMLFLVETAEPSFLDLRSVSHRKAPHLYTT